MSIHEIVLPQTKPATEWVRGRALQKVSPQDPHARAQLQFGAAMLAWAKAGGHGRVGTEWEFRITPPQQITRPLVPDVAFLSFDRLGFEERAAALVPRMPPNVAIEVLSPDDRRADVPDKVQTYLKTFRHRSLPGFSIKVSTVFEETKPKRLRK